MFNTTIVAHILAKKSLLCVGLDPDPAHMPAALREHPDALFRFCATLIEALDDLVCAFKPNIAFFEAYGSSGIAALERLCALPRRTPLILDAKRGDIGTTAAAYAQLIFDRLDADAVTLSPYLGSESLAPFLRHAERGCFVLCRTSNNSASDLQDLRLADGRPLYHEVARLARDIWNSNGNVGLVAGATRPEELRSIRRLCPGLPLLVPGVGAQGGDLAAAVAAAIDADGAGALISVSRAVLYASSGADYLDAARAAARDLRDAINAVRGARGSEML